MPSDFRLCLELETPDPEFYFWYEGCNLPIRDLKRISSGLLIIKKVDYAMNGNKKDVHKPFVSL